MKLLNEWVKEKNCNYFVMALNNSRRGISFIKSLDFWLYVQVLLRLLIINSFGERSSFSLIYILYIAYSLVFGVLDVHIWLTKLILRTILIALLILVLHNSSKKWSQLWLMHWLVSLSYLVSFRPQRDRDSKDMNGIWGVTAEAVLWSLHDYTYMYI